MSFWIHPSLHGSHPGATGLTMSIQEWNEKLSLSPEQTRQLTSILNDFSSYYDNLLADGNTRIMEILDPAQKLKYQKMLREHKQ